MQSDSHHDHHARRRERRRRVKQLRQKPLGDLNVLPTFLSETLGPSSDAATATAAELGPLLDGTGHKVKDQTGPDAPEGEDEADVPSP